MNFGRFVLRAVIGGFFIGHGTQKLFGWFEGHGLEGTGQFFESVGLRPGRRHALAAGAAEAGGGALLAAGLATPVAAGSLSAVMLTAIRKVHLKNGPWVNSGGYEYTAVLLAALLTLAELGPGGWSLDAAIGTEKRGTRWALAALALGAGGSALALRRAAMETPADHAEAFAGADADLATTAEAREVGDDAPTTATAAG
jgi:putative oxidoreductase